MFFTSSFAPAAMLMNESLALKKIPDEEKNFNGANTGKCPHFQFFNKYYIKEQIEYITMIWFQRKNYNP